MTQRNKLPQAKTVSSGTAGVLRVALAGTGLVLVLITLITVLSGAGFGHV
ncbi:MAG TPA: hypothetical protein VFS99_08030 [Xanthomonadaceae bacterium]|nr:hypothetical protein [Xanthomonadaceae bacterium]